MIPGTTTTAASAELAELAEQVASLLAAGRTTEVDRLIEAHPEHGERLAQLLPAMKLLAHAGGSGERGAPAAGRADSAAFTQPGTLGDFRIVREVGRGGMGVVYEAEQISLGRRVALKVLPFAALLDPRQLQRFQNEARAAAALHHTSIVPVYAVGSDRGVHFYAMQFIEGRSLAEILRAMRGAVGRSFPTGGHDGAGERAAAGAVRSDAAERGRANPFPPGSDRPTDAQAGPALTDTNGGKPLPSTAPADPGHDYFRTVARWGAQIAGALDYAHALGVVHRDVKPANVMIDSAGNAWVTDFGLAQVEADPGLTVTGDVVGTLRYMSPEQAIGARGVVDQRADVYSLGATLYELLTLRPAFAAKDHAALLAQISQSEPRRPRTLNREIPADLETIVLKALEKEPAGRYATAGALADDLRRFLDHQVIAARRPSLAERLRKWRRRNRALARGIAVLAAVLVLGAATSAALVYNERQKASYERALRAQQELAAREGDRAIQQNRYVVNISLAAHAWSGYDHELQRVKEHLADCLPESGEEDLRGFEWHYLWGLCRAVPEPLGRHEGEPFTAQFTSDGKTLATAGKDGIRIWDWDSGRQVVWLREHEGDVNSVSFTPDGSVMATAGNDGTIRIWDTGEWKVNRALEVGSPAAALFSPDGRRLAAGTGSPDGAKGEFVIFDTSDWSTEWQVADLAGLRSGAIAPDSRHAALVFANGVVQLYDLANRRLVSQVDASTEVRSVAFSTSGDLLATAGTHGRLIVWPADLPSGAVPSIVSDRMHPLTSVAFLPDGRLLSAGDDRLARVWQFVDSPTGRTGYITHALRHEEGLYFVRAAPDGRSLATGGKARTIHRWQLDGPHPYRRRLGEPGAYRTLRYSPRGDFLLAAGNGARILDPATGEELTRLEPDYSNITYAAISRDGRMAGVGTRDSRLTVWDVETRTAIGDFDRNTLFGGLAHPELRIHAISFSDDASRVFLATQFVGMPCAFDPRTGRTLDPGFPSDAPLRDIAHSPDGRFVSVGDYQGQNIWDTRRHDWAFLAPKELMPLFSEDGRLLLSVRGQTTVHVRRTATWDVMATLAIHTGRIVSMAISADHRTLAVATDRGSVELWNIATGRPLMTLADDFHEVWSVAFDPDGTALAAGGDTVNRAGDFRLWRIGSLVSEAQAHESTRAE